MGPRRTFWTWLEISTIARMQNTVDNLCAQAGPMEDYRRLGLLDTTSPLRDSMDAALFAHQKFADQFRLPEVTELQKLAYGDFALNDLVGRFGGGTGSYKNS